MSDFKSTNGARAFAKIAAPHFVKAARDVACLCAVAVLTANAVLAAYFAGWGWVFICIGGIVYVAWSEDAK